mmetsp:Transcript_6428/g.26540  ORF Transcript_6428/g.26540 Transcript_6428/m.26540 type:complete len:372 (+) Transcript_6428:403-1518(+)
MPPEVRTRAGRVADAAHALAASLHSLRSGHSLVQQGVAFSRGRRPKGREGERRAALGLGNHGGAWPGIRPDAEEARRRGQLLGVRGGLGDDLDVGLYVSAVVGPGPAHRGAPQRVQAGITSRRCGRWQRCRCGPACPRTGVCLGGARRGRPSGPGGPTRRRVAGGGSVPGRAAARASRTSGRCCRHRDGAVACLRSGRWRSSQGAGWRQRRRRQRRRRQRRRRQRVTISAARLTWPRPWWRRCGHSPRRRHRLARASPQCRWRRLGVRWARRRHRFSPRPSLPRSALCGAAPPCLRCSGAHGRRSAASTRRSRRQSRQLRRKPLQAPTCPPATPSHRFGKVTWRRKHGQSRCSCTAPGQSPSETPGRALFA